MARHFFLTLVLSAAASCGFAQEHRWDWRHRLIEKGPPARSLFNSAPTAPIGEQNRGLREASSAMLSGPRYRLPGEFERQRAILVSCHEFIQDAPELLAEIVAQVQGRVEVIALVNDVVESMRAQDALVQRGLPRHHIRFAEVPHDTMWCRDYGPILVEGSKGDVVAVDARYIHASRPLDDDVPLALCRQLKLPVVSAPFRIEGGNLLSNGHGVCVTTTHVLTTNADQSDEHSIRAAMRQCFGAEQAIFLEPLSGEPTGHVDMFATFTSRNTIVVGQYDRETDAVNSEILDRNARRLAQVRTNHGTLRVIRVPMPPRDGAIWRTYTNVVYANGLLLVPAYPSVDDAGRTAALNIYRELLPRWEVVAIDTARLAKLGGAIHCVTMNLGPLKEIPLLVPPRKLTDELNMIAATSFLLPVVPQPLRARAQ
jgi:agmatine/peptidylarginine deiminase